MRDLNKYYLFQINENGNLSLSKNEIGSFKNLILDKNKYINNYNKNNTYKLGISFNPYNGNIITSINDELIYSIIDKDLNGNRVGIISYGNNTIFKQIIAEEI